MILSTMANCCVTVALLAATPPKLAPVASTGFAVLIGQIDTQRGGKRRVRHGERLGGQRVVGQAETRPVQNQSGKNEPRHVIANRQIRGAARDRKSSVSVTPAQAWPDCCCNWGRRCVP